MKRVTEADRKLFNELYYKYKSYAEVARQTGWGAATVKNYIDPNFTPLAEENIVRFDIENMPKEFDISQFLTSENFGEFCVLTEEEKKEMKVLAKNEVLV